MSFLTAAHLMHKYGPLFTEEQLGEVLHMEPGTIRNQRGSGALGIPFIRKAYSAVSRGGRGQAQRSIEVKRRLI